MQTKNSSRLTSRWTAGASAMAIVVALTASASAEQAATSGGIETVVVTAQFTEQNIQVTPLSITAVTGSELHERGFNELSNINSSIPGLTLTKQEEAFGPGVSAFIRGVGQADTAFAGEPGVGMYIDDIYYGTLFGSSLEMFDLARIEVLRGPQGVLGGKNNIGGSIRLVSQKPQGGNTGYAEIGYGSYDEIEMRASADLTIVPDKLFLRVTGLSRTQDGYITVEDYRCKFGSGLGPTGGGNLPVTTDDPDCQIGTQGGTDVRAARASARVILPWHMEDVLSADILRDNSENRADTLAAMDIGGPNVFVNMGHGIKAVPRTQFYTPNSNGIITQSGATAVNWNNNFNIPHYGIPWDTRFMADPFERDYATYRSSDGLAYNNGAHVHSYGFSNIFDWDLTDHVHFKNINGWRYFNTWNSNDTDVSPMSYELVTTVTSDREFQEEGRFTGDLFEGHLQWTAGAFYYTRTNENHGPVNIEAPGAPFLKFEQSDRYETSSKSVYAHVIYTWNQFDLFAGARYSKDKKTYFFDHSGIIPGVTGSIGFFRNTVDPSLDCNLFAGHVPCDHTIHPKIKGEVAESSRPDWRAGVDWHVTDDDMLYVQYSTGYRSGGFNSRPFDPLQLNSYGAEQLKAWEIGAKTDWFDHRLRVNVAAYDNKSTDTAVPLAQTDAFHLPWVHYVNLGSSKRQGFEIEAQAAPIDGLLIDFSYSYIHTKNNPVPGAPRGWLDGCTVDAFNSGKCPQVSPGTVPLNRPVGGYPARTAHFDIQYAWELPNWGTLTPRLDYNYQSTIHGATKYLDIESRGLWDARVTWDAPAGGWQLSAFVTNLADKHYFYNVFDLTGFDLNTAEGQPAPGREWLLQIRKSF